MFPALPTNLTHPPSSLSGLAECLVTLEMMAAEHGTNTNIKIELFPYCLQNQGTTSPLFFPLHIKKEKDVLRWPFLRTTIRFTHFILLSLPVGKSYIFGWVIPMKSMEIVKVLER